MMLETLEGYYCDDHMKSGLEKQELESRKPVKNLWPLADCELIKTLTRNIGHVNGKEHYIFFLLIPKLFPSGLYQNVLRT